MSLPTRTLLDAGLTSLDEKLLQMGSLVDTMIEQAMIALYNRDVLLAQQVVVEDLSVNELRYDAEDLSLQIMATQQPMARDLRRIIAAIHIAVELERIGDHAAGIASLVERMEEEEEIESLHKLPKMAKRARSMVSKGVQAFVECDPDKAHSIIGKDDKIDRQYRRLFRETVSEMQDDDYIRRATFLLWVGHDLERIGDRATNIAERVIFMATGDHIEIQSDHD
jgi:phosphate transport system protein